MKHLHLRVPKVWIFGLMLLLIVLTTAPVSAASDEISLLFPSLTEVGCNVGELEIPFVTIIPDKERTYNIRTILAVAGTVYMDELHLDIGLTGVLTNSWRQARLQYRGQQSGTYR